MAQCTVSQQIAGEHNYAPGTQIFLNLLCSMVDSLLLQKGPAPAEQGLVPCDKLNQCA
jgi:hypothetical protein